MEIIFIVEMNSISGLCKCAKFQQERWHS